MSNNANEGVGNKEPPPITDEVPKDWLPLILVLVWYLV